jgi:hypothetical protein
VKLFLGGSRHLVKIPPELVDFLQERTLAGDEFLVGDAHGSDTSFQQVLQRMGVRSVTVFSSAGYVRNNLGMWPSEEIDSGLKSKSNAAHAIKDRHMTGIADCGLMLWDCKSAGTLSNIIDMVESGKNCKIWVAQDSQLYSFDNKPSLEKWLTLYPEVATEARKRLSTFRRREVKRIAAGQPDLFE